MSHVKRVFAVGMLLLVSAGNASAACWLYDVQVATVCTEWEGGRSCNTTVYEYYYCDVGGGSTGGGTTNPPSGGGSPSAGFYDSNGNGVIDEWRGVVQTDDPCANNFDANDRLGTDHGGTNTTRPHHSGVDIQANLNDPVYPVFSGTVEQIGTVSGCGYRVQIANDNGTHTTYCHMATGSSPLTVGQRVSAGYTHLGGVDSTGDSTGDHLHITQLDANYNISGEYFQYTDSQPSSGQLDPGGC